ncbi:MAG TPA: helix-turn-helix domain-containing protein [Frankiaceae bacterium]|jgi:AcrR family transcriptional regulator|nr:helix-turn-helix domain-containing protein [Frankiaceae bacterium]
MAAAQPQQGRDESSARPRRYVSPIRRRQADQTRERILAAGVELVRGFDSWDWNGLTFRAVAQQAGVGERTVYRHFPNERGLRDAIMTRLGEEAGVDYGRLSLADVGEVASRMFRSLGSFAVSDVSSPPDDPTFIAVDRDRREALIRAVAESKPGTPAQEQLRLAAALDVLWGVPSYDRLVAAWGMTADEAVGVLAWAIEQLTTPPSPGVDTPAN